MSLPLGEMSAHFAQNHTKWTHWSNRESFIMCMWALCRPQTDSKDSISQLKVMHYVWCDIYNYLMVQTVFTLRDVPQK